MKNYYTLVNSCMMLIILVTGLHADAQNQVRKHRNNAEAVLHYQSLQTTSPNYSLPMMSVMANEAPQISSAAASASPICLGGSTNLTATSTTPDYATTGFTGSYAPATWTFNAGPGGSMPTNNASTVSLTSGNSNSAGYTTRNRPNIHASKPAVVTFNWSYVQSANDNAGWDYPVYFVNGAAFSLTGFSTGGANSQSGLQTVSVPAGQSFALGVYTVDGQFGGATTAFSNFTVTYVSDSSIQWFTVPSGGSSIGSSASGAMFSVTPSLVSINSYYAQATSPTNGNSLSRTLVTVTANQNVTYYADVDGDGFGNMASPIVSCMGAPKVSGNPAVLDSSDCDDTITMYVDADGDGVGSSVKAPCGGILTNTDCKDTDAAVFQISTYYIDADGDGFSAGTFTGCFGASASAGYSATSNGSDCDDNLVTYADDDGDGFGSDILSPCSGITNSDDCDDTLIYYVDSDSDGYGSTALSPCSSVTNNTDCDDADADSYMEGFLFIDTDGDGFTSGQEFLCHGNIAPTGYSFTSKGEDCDDQTLYYVDADADGFGSASFSSCSGITNNTDCDDAVLMYGDADGDGVGSTELIDCGDILTSTDCDDSDSSMNQQFAFFPDNDGDGFGESGSVSQLICAVNAATPPTGYSVNATDCDDTFPAINPGAAEIGYNLIDDDCDGLIDEGFPPKIAQVSAATCGTILPALDTPIYANLIAGAQGYRWRVTTISGVNPGQIQFLDTPLRTLKLTQLTNYAYATTYKIEAAVYFAGFLQPFTSSTCTVSTPEAKTKLTSCPQLLTSFTNVIFANAVPFATGYRFKITDPVNPANTQTLNRALREFRMTNITAFEVLYGKTYIVQVAVRNTDGSYLPFGDVCAVSTSQFPTTEIGSAQCDNGFGLPYAVPSMNTPIYANSYPGAIAYVFRLTGVGLPPAGVEVAKQLRVFKLSDFGGMGINPGQSYNVNVRIIFELDAPIGSYGKTCTLTVPAASSRMIEMPFDAVAYPNPFNDSFNVSITSSHNESVFAKVYDMTGRLLESIEFENQTEEMTIGERYPSGIYSVIISQGNENKTLRVIKR